MVPEDVNDSTEKMTEFVVMAECSYGKAHMTSNLYTLLHLLKSVLLYMSLGVLSHFPFESNMGHVLKLVSSSNGVPFQILSQSSLQ